MFKEDGNSIAQYTRAKLEGDEELIVWGDERRKKNAPGLKFRYIKLRPGYLVIKRGVGRWS